MDKPMSAVDAIAALSVEAPMHELAGQIKISVLIHRTQQAARKSDHTAVMLMATEGAGELIESSPTREPGNPPIDNGAEPHIAARV
jgi:phosphate transport system ATP-binding protein